MTMVMRDDDRYVDRRIKIFQVKRKGPQFDVKRIAADLKAKTQTTMAPAVKKKVQQTKSDLINSIKIRTRTVPVSSSSRRTVQTSLLPLESTTILDSSDEVRTYYESPPHHRNPFNPTIPLC